MKEFSIGDENEGVGKIKIRLLNAEPILTDGKGSREDENGDGFYVYDANTPSHGFVFTSDGDLYIDYNYAGRFINNEVLTFGSGRIWSNGIPRLTKPMTDKQIELFYPEVGADSQEDGTHLVSDVPWNIYMKPSGGGGSVSVISKSWVFTKGMTVIRIEHERLIVNSIDYGTVARGQSIKVRLGVVSVDGVVRMPQAISILEAD